MLGKTWNTALLGAAAVGLACLPASAPAQAADGVLKIVVRVATETGESAEVVLDAIPLAPTSGENV